VKRRKSYFGCDSLGELSEKYQGEIKKKCGMLKKWQPDRSDRTLVM
jgi:hypothetical protein